MVAACTESTDRDLHFRTLATIKIPSREQLSQFYRTESIKEFVQNSLNFPLDYYLFCLFLFSLLIDPFDVLVSIGRSSVFDLGSAIFCIWFDRCEFSGRCSYLSVASSWYVVCSIVSFFKICTRKRHTTQTFRKSEQLFGNLETNYFLNR